MIRKLLRARRARTERRIAAVPRTAGAELAVGQRVAIPNPDKAGDGTVDVVVTFVNDDRSAFRYTHQNGADGFAFATDARPIATPPPHRRHDTSNGVDHERARDS